MYKIRSKIVHGDKPKLDKDEIDKLEEILRESIKLWIKDNTKFSTDQHSNSGKLISEGVLSNIFFTSETN